jgi:hypothetical protein
MLIINTLQLLSIFFYIILYAFKSSNTLLQKHLIRINIIYGIIIMYYSYIIVPIPNFFYNLKSLGLLLLRIKDRVAAASSSHPGFLSEASESRTRELEELSRKGNLSEKPDPLELLLSSNPDFSKVSRKGKPESSLFERPLREIPSFDQSLEEINPHYDYVSYSDFNKDDLGSPEQEQPRPGLLNISSNNNNSSSNLDSTDSNSFLFRERGLGLELDFDFDFDFELKLNCELDKISFFNDQIYLTHHNVFTFMGIYLIFIGLGIFKYNREQILIITLAICLINLFLSTVPNALLILWLTLEGITISAYLLMSQFIGNIKYYIISLFITNLSLFLFLFQFNIDIILPLLLLTKLGIYPLHQWIYSLYGTTDTSILIFYHIILKFPLYICLNEIIIVSSISISKIIIMIQFMAVISSITIKNIMKFIGISSISLTASLLLLVIMGGEGEGEGEVGVGVSVEAAGGDNNNRIYCRASDYEGFPYGKASAALSLRAAEEATSATPGLLETLGPISMVENSRSSGLQQQLLQLRASNEGFPVGKAEGALLRRAAEEALVAELQQPKFCNPNSVSVSVSVNENENENVNVNENVINIHNYTYIYYYLIYIITILLIIILSKSGLYNPREPGPLNRASSLEAPVAELKQPKRPSIILITIAAMSLIGLPPLPGFYAKLYLLNDLFINYGLILTGLYLIFMLILASEYIRRFIIDLELR